MPEGSTSQHDDSQPIDLNESINISNQQILLDAGVNDDDIPSDFICPLTLEVMDDPVTTPDGKTYERSELERWWNTQNNALMKQLDEGSESSELTLPYCPETRSPLLWGEWEPNQPLKAEIDAFVAQMQHNHDIKSHQVMITRQSVK